MKKIFIALALALTVCAVGAQVPVGNAPAAGANVAAAGNAPAAAVAADTVATPTPPLVNDSIHAIFDRALAGDAAAQTEVGLWYYNGVNVLQDYNQAVQWWLRAAEQGSAAATGNLGVCYADGTGVTADSTRATKLILRSLKQGNETLRHYITTKADSGNVFCSAIVAESMARTRSGVTMYPDAALPYLNTCAEAGSLLSMNRLALAYYNKRDFRQAFRWFNSAADRGNLNAKYFAASMLVEGKGVAANATRGAEMLLQASREGHANAMYLLGKCYLEGKGLTTSPENAMMWWQRSAAAGNPRAAWDVARANVDGTICAKNFDNAMLYFAIAAKHSSNRRFVKYASDSIAGTDFGRYVEGRRLLLADSIGEAFDEFKHVARNFGPEGKLWQGFAYLDPDYNKHNDGKAFKEVKNAAEAGFAPAQLQYAVMFETAIGTARDMVKAVENYTAAAEAGYGPAMCALASIYFEGRGVEQSYEQAVVWYEKAWQIGLLDQVSARRLADCYENGLGGLQPDTEKVAALRAVATPDVDALLRAL